MADAEAHSLWQNQRYFIGRGWRAPAGLLGDPPAWTTADGAAAAVPAEGPGDGWSVALDNAHDIEGWEYAGSFAMYERSRDGGRGISRKTDVVRRRCWLKADSATERGVAVKPADELAAARAVRKEEEHKALKESVTILITLLAKRPTLHALALGDIVAWKRLWDLHKEKFSIMVHDELQPQLSEDDRARLGGLLFAFPYAKAVYGLPILEGFDTVGYDGSGAGGAKKYMAKRMKDPNFEPMMGADARTNIEAMLKMSGRNSDELLHASFTPTPLGPCHAVLIDREASAVVLTIRGTLSPQDAMTNCVADAVADEAECGDGGSFHDGHLRAAKWIAEQAGPALQKAAKECPGFRLVVTGHSLGAGVAAILTLLLDARIRPGSNNRAAERPPTGTVGDDLRVMGGSALDMPFSHVECYAFGCPGVASPEISMSPRALRCVTSVACGKDIIPRLSFRSIDELLIELSDRSISKSMASSLNSGKQWFKSSVLGQSPTNAVAERPASRWEQHLPVGRCFQLLSQSRSQEFRVLPAEPPHFKRIVVSPRMFMDHLVSVYDNLLSEACLAHNITAGLPTWMGSSCSSSEQALVSKQGP